MKWKPNNPEPTPEQLSAWADGELNRPDAEAVERWLRAHPDAARDAAQAAGLTNLFRDHPPPEPTERAWQAALCGIESALAHPLPLAGRPQGRHWRFRLLLGLAAAAAVLGGLALARPFWTAPGVRPQDSPLAGVRPPAPPSPTPGPAGAAEEPFPVAEANEVNFLSISVEDADRVVVVGPPLLGAFELAAPQDITVVGMEPPAAGPMPRLQRGPEVPMILVASADREDP